MSFFTVFLKKYGLARGRDVTMMAGRWVGSFPGGRSKNRRNRSSSTAHRRRIRSSGCGLSRTRFVYKGASLKGFLYYRGNRPGSIRILAKI
jgi:hypothetical protein